MHSPFNSLLADGLAQCGLMPVLEARRNAEGRKACWQTRAPTHRDQHRSRLWEASAHAGHGESKRGSLRKIKLKAKRSF